MDIKNFRTLKKIIELGSFGKAAQALGYAQSTITFHIQSLEEYYKMPIFNRIGKSVELTQFGHMLSEQADILLNAYDVLENCSMSESSPHGVIRIGAPESLMLYRLPDIVKEYKQTYPNVEIIIINDMCPNLRDRLGSHDLDVSLLLQPVYKYPQLETILLKKEEMCFVAPYDYQGEDFLPVDSQMVLYTEKDCDYRQIFSNYLKSHNYYPTNILETGSVEAIKKYIFNGLGISYLPFYSVMEDAEQNKLRVRKHTSGVTFYTQLVYHKKKWLNPALKAFIDLCIRHAETWQPAACSVNTDAIPL